MTRAGVRARLYLALAPAVLIVVVAYLGTMAWTVGMSFTESRAFPVWRFAGLLQYDRLLGTARWQASLVNMAVIGVLTIGASLAIGFLLAVALDQRIRAEGVFRTVMLYPFAMSFVVTGIAWQWMLNPELGVQQAVRRLGWTSFAFDWIVGEQTALYCVVLAAVWQSAGLVMVIMLAGLRGVDEDLWKATRIDGVAAWQVYRHIVLPMLGPSIGSAGLLLSLNVVKMYDLVVALTGGGPGLATEVPAKFVMEYLFNRQNIGLACAGATTLIVIVMLALVALRGAGHVRTVRMRRA